MEDEIINNLAETEGKLLEANNSDFSFSQENITLEKVNEFLKTSFNISRLIRNVFKNIKSKPLTYDLTQHDGDLKSPTLKDLKKSNVEWSYFRKTGNNNRIELMMDGDTISIIPRKGKNYKLRDIIPNYDMSSVLDKEIDQTFKKLITTNHIGYLLTLNLEISAMIKADFWKNFKT